MIRDVLQKLAETEGSPPALEVERLSGLETEELNEFRAEWPKLSAERRRAILALAVQLAENDIEFDFGPVLKVCLSDTDAAVRTTAIEGLWEDEEFRTADRLADLLRHDSAENVRIAAAMVLARFTQLADDGKLYRPTAERVRRALESAALNASESIDVRRRSIEALATVGGEVVDRLITSAYADRDPRMQASAIYAMGRTCDQRWLDTILREMENEDAELRFEAARAAGETQAPRSIVPLISLLDDEDLEVRLAAIGALGEIGGDLANKALQRCAKGKDQAMRAAAVEALSQNDLGSDPLNNSPFLNDSTRTV